MKHRVLVCGGRTFTAKTDLWKWLDDFDAEQGIETIIHGAARGADIMAGEWAVARQKQVIRCPAQWGLLAGYAGTIRNQRMLTFQPDLILACPGGPGTQNMVLTARFRGFRVEYLYGRPG
jgi:hypothetical protein